MENCKNYKNGKIAKNGKMQKMKYYIFILGDPLRETHLFHNPDPWAHGSPLSP